jgi:hypothetical protein
MDDMDPADVRAFLDRRWHDASAAKRAYWAERYRAGGATETRAASDSLLTTMRAMHLDHPTPADRATDHQAHERLSTLISRAADAFASRPPAR